MITVRRVEKGGEGDLLAFDVAVRNEGSETNHRVTISRKLCERLTGGEHTPDQAVEASFRFLLDREPKECILRRFDISVISSYFPEFERELPPYLKRGAFKEP